MSRKILPAIIVVLLVLAGCARSSDGTVVIPAQLDMRRIWDKPPALTTVAGGQTVFPPPPSQDVPAVTQKRTQKRKTAAASSGPAAASGTGKPVSCQYVTEPGKRYRMNCS